MATVIMHILTPGALAVVLVAAAATDLRWRRIPNWLTLGGAAIGVGLALVRGGPEAALTSLVGWLLGLGLLLPLFLLRGMGGGDIKLLAAVGAFVGPTQVIITVVWAGLIGGVIALALLTYRRQLGPALIGLLVTRSLPRLGDAGAVTLPYGVAIAGGGLIARFLGGGGL